ncbi:hypothetical protein FRUB_06697 [Fimbriiglobus ruber]|uniref:Uncharacterized protein n=1 Tax=Fimbriiglobus ruber TaxID=1908690 RepID=A0A225DN28_9BACT|nr:hypothetical protein FRUB_06697 [Fimbriiglobus ruber]
MLGYAGERVPDEQLDLVPNRLVNKAIKKPITNPFVIFIDLNLPPLPHDPLSADWLERVAAPLVRDRDRKGEPDPWNLLLLSNFPDHYADDDASHPRGYVNGVFGKNPVHAVAHPEAFTAIVDAALQYGSLPQ